MHSIVKKTTRIWDKGLYYLKTDAPRAKGGASSSISPGLHKAPAAVEAVGRIDALLAIEREPSDAAGEAARAMSTATRW
jgi:hypothetical protein